MKFIFYSIIALVHSALLAQQITPLWQLREATNGSIDAYTPLVLVDSFHNIITCGSTYTPGPATGFVTFKYNQDGDKLWERRHQTSATDFITAAATDREGAVYVGGVTINNPLGGTGNQVIFKYSAEGDTLWEYYLKVDQGISSSITNLLLDENDNLLIFGAYFDIIEQKGGLFVQKKSPEGTMLWTATHVETNYSYGASNARYVGDHWVFWGRNSSSAAGGTRLLCWQIGLDGQTLDAAASGLNPEIIYPLHLDAEGNLFLTRGAEYKVVKYNITATKEWEYTKPSMVLPQGQLYALTTDEHLNIYSIGHVRIDSAHVDALNTKLNNSGEVLWEHHLSFTNFPFNLSADRLVWLKQNLLLTAGNISVNPDSNFSKCFFAVYNSDGFLQGGLPEILGRKNRITSITPDGNFFYTTGQLGPENYLIDTTKLFLHKYALQDLVSTTNPIKGMIGQMSVWPNPASGQCSILLDNNTDARSGILQICNAQGIVVYRAVIPLPYGSQAIEIESFARFPAGIYQTSILTEARMYSAKMLKGR